MEGKYAESNGNSIYENLITISAHSADTRVVQNFVLKSTETSVPISENREEMGSCVVHNCVVKLVQLDHYHDHLNFHLSMWLSLYNT